MLAYLTLLIPITIIFYSYFSWRNKFVWWELLLPFVASFVFTVSAKLIYEGGVKYDIQYYGGLGNEIWYYEPYETWVSQTCSRQVPCGTTTVNGQTQTQYCTEYYDCSYCSNHSSYTTMVDDQGNTFSITQKEFDRIKKKWNTPSIFVELNRNISYHFGCGKDGDAYKTKWDYNMLTNEATTLEKSYTNYVQASKSSLGLQDISEDEAKKYGLYEYPKVVNYTQDAILGLDSLQSLDQNRKLGAQVLFRYFNGYYGPKRKLHVFVLLFYNKSIDVAVKQKSYWDGANKNEFVICIGTDKYGKIDWVYPFTWTENKRIEVDLREDITEMKTLDFTKMYHLIDDATPQFMYRDFEQFKYLSIDLPKGFIFILCLLNILITVGILRYGYINEYVNEEANTNKK